MKNLLDEAADTTRVLRGERVVHIDDVGDDAAPLLGRRQRLEQECRHPDAVRSEHLADATARPPANAEDTVELGNARRKHVDVRVGQVAEPL